MKIYIVSCEIMVPHNEFEANLGAFKDKQSALNFIEHEYENTMISLKTNPGYFIDLCEDKAFDEFSRYIYCKQGYYYAWKLEEFELE